VAAAAILVAMLCHRRCRGGEALVAGGSDPVQRADLHALGLRGAPADVYATPSTSATRITKLHWRTEDAFSEIYVLLRAHWDQRGREWIKLRIPGRPNGRTGWVQADALRPSTSRISA